MGSSSETRPRAALAAVDSQVPVPGCPGSVEGPVFPDGQCEILTSDGPGFNSPSLDATKTLAEVPLLVSVSGCTGARVS